MNEPTVLQRTALVLNRHWAPVRTAPVREVLGLVARGAAKIIEPGTYAVHDLRSWHDATRARARFGEALVRSPRLVLLAPELAVLTGYAGRGGSGVVFSRRNLFRRDRRACQYCGARPAADALTIDHVLPRSRGGRSTWENCVLACVDCNRRKAARTPEEAGMTLRKAPRRPAWRALLSAPGDRRESWDAFLSRAYWDAEILP